MIYVLIGYEGWSSEGEWHWYPNILAVSTDKQKLIDWAGEEAAWPLIKDEHDKFKLMEGFRNFRVIEEHQLL